MKKNKNEHHSKSWAIPGFMFIGIGIGILTGEVASFTLIGLGIGFIVSYLHNKK